MAIHTHAYTVNDERVYCRHKFPELLVAQLRSLGGRTVFFLYRS
jgi:hypothetical protein